MTREQFIKLVEGTQMAFRRFLVALCCGDAALADDIAQDAYIKAYLSCESLNNIDKFNAWLFKIGYNTFISHKRSEKFFADYEEARNIMAVETTDSQFRYQELYTALNKIPDKERTSVLLFYMEGYSVKEIAELEETSQDAVKQHLSRGRNHLRGLLSNS
jgi:RNA polymerase sigma-70 factor (ECF subfamily)